MGLVEKRLREQGEKLRGENHVLRETVALYQKREQVIAAQENALANKENALKEVQKRWEDAIADVYALKARYEELIKSAELVTAELQRWRRNREALAQKE